MMKKQYILYVIVSLVWGMVFFACSEKKDDADTTDDPVVLVPSVVFDAAAIKAFEFSEGSDVEIPIPAATIKNGSGTITYSITVEDDTVEADAEEDDAEDPMFVIGGEESNQIVLAEGKLLDHESNSSYTLTITATVGSLTATIDITITVTDVDTIIFSSGKASVTVSENTWTNIPIPPASVEDDTSHETFTYSITAGDDAADPMFAIGGEANNQIVLADGKSLDYESGTISYILTITATATADETVTGDVEVEITVEDANDVPVITAITDSTAFAENTPTTDVLIDIDATDQDAGQTATLTYAINPENAFFTMDDATGEIRFTVSPDHETEDHRMNTLAIEVTDTGGSIATTNITITVTPIDDVIPTITSHSDNEIILGKPGYAEVTTFIVKDDVPRTDPFTFTHAGTDVGIFNLDATTGALTFGDVTHAMADSTYSITALVKDTNGSNDYNFTIQILGLFFKTVDRTGADISISIAEDYLWWDVPGLKPIEAEITNGRGSETVEYAIASGNTDGVFGLHATGTTTKLVLADRVNKRIDFANSPYLLEITAAADFVPSLSTPMSMDTLSNSFIVTIDVTADLDFAFFRAGTHTFTFAENVVSTGAIGSSRALPGLIVPEATFDNGVTTSSIDYTIGGVGADLFEIDSTTRQLSLKADKVLDYEANDDHRYSLSLSASANSHTASYGQGITINVTDIQETPWIISMSNTSGNVAATASYSNHVGYDYGTNSNTINITVTTNGGSDNSFTFKFELPAPLMWHTNFISANSRSGRRIDFYQGIPPSISGVERIELLITNDGANDDNHEISFTRKGRTAASKNFSSGETFVGVFWARDSQAGVGDFIRKYKLTITVN